MHFFVSK